jgi:hypothetical protein
MGRPCLTHGESGPYRSDPMAQPETPRSRPVLFWGIALLTILAGFVDLWRGGETIAPILLVVGYCVLIPMAILK